MTAPLRNLVGGAVVAAFLASIIGIPTIAGVDTWKWILGLVGLAGC